MVSINQNSFPLYFTSIRHFVIIEFAINRLPIKVNCHEKIKFITILIPYISTS